MAPLSTIDISKMEPVCLFVCFFNCCSGEGSKANIGWAFDETYQLIVATVGTTFCLRLLSVLTIQKFPRLRHPHPLCNALNNNTYV